MTKQNRFQKQATSFMKKVQSAHRSTIAPNDKYILENELANLLKNAYVCGKITATKEDK